MVAHARTQRQTRASLPGRIDAHVWLASLVVCASTIPFSEYAAECSVMESGASLSVGGGNCEIDVDECASSPCLTGAFVICSRFNSQPVG